MTMQVFWTACVVYALTMSLLGLRQYAKQKALRAKNEQTVSALEKELFRRYDNFNR